MYSTMLRQIIDANAKRKHFGHSKYQVTREKLNLQTKEKKEHIHRKSFSFDNSQFILDKQLN